MFGRLRRVFVVLLDVVRASLWRAVCETLKTRLPSVFHGLNSQVFLDSCRLFWRCLMPFNPRGTRDAGFCVVSHAGCFTAQFLQRVQGSQPYCHQRSTAFQPLKNL